MKEETALGLVRCAVDLVAATMESKRVMVHKQSPHLAPSADMFEAALESVHKGYKSLFGAEPGA